MIRKSLIVMRRPAIFLSISTLVAMSFSVWSMDTDIFTITNTANSGPAPNVLIVLDNTSNWSRQDEHWPGGIQQGQAEVDAIKTVIQSLHSSVNVGLLEFVTGGPATDNGGYIRFAVSPMGSSQTNGTVHQAAFSNVLTTIYNDINGPTEKQNSNVAYGNLMYDVYNYFAGVAPHAASTDVVSSLADSNGYITNYTQFRSPLSASTSCARNYIIFIGNPNASGPRADDSPNLTALGNLGGNTSQLLLPNYTTTTQTLSDNLGYSSACYASHPTATPVDYSALCPPSAESSYTSCGYSATDSITSILTCPVGQSYYSVLATTTSSSSSTTSQTLAPVPLTGDSSDTACTQNSPNNSSISNCPTSAPTISTSGNVTTTITRTYSCAYQNTGVSCGNGNSGKTTWNAYKTETNTTTTTTTTTTTNTLGDSGCYSSAGACSTASITCPPGATCSCGTAITGGSCSSGSARYQALGYYTQMTDIATGTYSADTATFNADEWARFLYQLGVPVSGGSNQTISTYTIDVYNAKPNPVQSGLLASMAKNGGGKYFTATNEQAIINALQAIFSEVLAVNSTFASASLPISATNRAENDNQVYIGMFRPNPNALPRWFGNLKRFELAQFPTGIDLSDSIGAEVINTSTGFITPCAVSWWTVDSGNYWASMAGDGTVSPRVFFTSATTPGMAWTTQGDDLIWSRGECGTSGSNPYSDSPDGPVVEKGGVAEMLRQGTSRTMYTLSSSSHLVGFDGSSVTASADAAINGNIVNFTQGQDVTGEINGLASTSRRPSIHGDVIHSRPLPVDYGGSTGVVVYYGANDGTYRAVEAETGAEKWSFVAPEFNSSLQRLLDNSPLVASTPKGFFFDGSTGLYSNADSSRVWIYPAMRRGGRMLYAFDVSNPPSPSFLWKVGCPNGIGDNTGCTSGFTGIGQTWSTPVLGFLPGYSTSNPVIAVGGGYDTCEDQDVTPTQSGFCSSPHGAAVYILDAASGAILAGFPTLRSVAADIAFVDVNFDQTVDAAYAVDTGGNIYRIDFSDTSFHPLASAEWSMSRVAYTNGAGRKFLFAPALLPYQNKVYLALGSGDREHPLIGNYPYTTPITNRFYVYLDDPSRRADADSETDTATNLDGSRMSDYTTDPGCDATKNILPGQDDTKPLGWYMNLTAHGIGEQTVTSALIVGGMVTFSTNQPVDSSNSCSTSLGNAWGYWVNLLNGAGAIGVTGICNGVRQASFVGGGLPPSPVMGTVTIDHSQKTVIIGAAQRNRNASSSIAGQEIRPPITSGRRLVYWRSGGDTH